MQSPVALQRWNFLQYYNRRIRGTSINILGVKAMNTISSSKPLKEDFERRYRKNLEMLNPNAAGLDLHKEEIWVCPGGFQDNHEPEVKTFGTLLLPQFNTCSSSGVFDRLLMKKSFDLLRLFLHASHMGFCMFLKLSIPFCCRSFGKGRFQIPVQ